ncbi:MAG TPA: MFS transporter [Myxococcota bacterium]|nr:MFS transporter [Myxococcota bacterium]
MQPIDSESRGPAAPVSGATWTIVVLTLMNLLNYVDRYVPSAVKGLFKEDLGLSDAQTSWPLTAFVVVYMLASPIFGGLADRASRPALIAFGVALWSIATAAGSLATGFWSFLAARALVGVGEAAYATIAPSLLSDCYPADQRNRVLTVFYVAIPVGSALGYVVGGLVGVRWGWRAAFLVCGLPGLLAALAALRIRDPGRGAFEAVSAPVSWGEALRALAANRVYVVTVLGYTAVTFAQGGLADWVPEFLIRVREMDRETVVGALGPITAVAALIGTASGGLLADRAKAWTRHPYLAVSALATLPAAGFLAAALFAPPGPLVFVCVFFAQLFLWFYNGPVNALIANAVDGSMRARAFALSILSIHLFGDAISPPIIGAISDTTGSLTQGIVLVPLFLVVGAAVWAAGWRRLPELAA